MRHPDLGRKLLDEIAEVLKGAATIERSPMMEGRMMSMIVSRAPGWEPPKKQVPPPTNKHSSSADTKASQNTQNNPVNMPPTPSALASEDDVVTAADVPASEDEVTDIDVPSAEEPPQS